MKLTKRQLCRIIREEKAGLLREGQMQFLAPAFSKMPMKSRAIPEFADAIKGRVRRNVREVYPIGGYEESSPAWKAFRDAAYEVAAGFIDAGMEADGVMGAMQDEIESIINEMDIEEY